MRRSYIVEIIFNLLLLVMFVGCSFIILLLGIEQYQNSVKRNELMQDLRQPFAYLTTKVHQSIGFDMNIITVDGESVYQIHEMIGQQEYITSIYCIDGYLMESFTPKDGFDLSLGNRVCPLDSFDVDLDMNSVLFDVCIATECETMQFKRV